MHRKLREFYESRGKEDAKVALERWYQIAEEAQWVNLSDIKVDFPSGIMWGTSIMYLI